MEFSEIVSVSKLPGLYHIHKQRTDGLILKSLIDDKVFFAASRAHSFTPLDNITIYTDDEPIELKYIMLKIKESNVEVPKPKSDAADLKSFFETVVPNYDSERVYNSDIQKIIKWFSLLDEKKLIPEPAKKATKKTTTEKSEKKAKTTKKAKKTKVTKKKSSE